MLLAMNNILQGFNTLENLIYCHTYIETYAGVLLYTHIPTAIATLFFAGVFLFKSEDRHSATMFLGLALSFATWIFLDLVIWFGYGESSLLMTAWSSLSLASLLMFFFSFSFAYVFFRKKHITLRALFPYFIPVILVAVCSPSNLYLIDFNAVECVATENNLFSLFVLGVKLGYVILIIKEAITSSLRKREKTGVIVTFASCILLFLIVHAFASYVGGLLNDYRYEAFSLLLMVLTLSVLTVLIAQYKLFNLRFMVMQMFVSILVLLVLAQLFFVEEWTSSVLVIFTTLVSMLVGYFFLKTYADEQATRRKGEQLARYLANANARLRELDKQKTDFVSVASHQLRSPIAAIKGYTSMIAEGSFGEVPEPMREPLSRVLESGKRIALMVDDFLNVTRIEQGRMTYSMERQNLCELIVSAVEELRSIGEKKGLAFNLGCGELAQKPVWIEGDAGKLRQVFSNIVDNAIKYTIAGSISISMQALKNHKAVLVKIADTGIGIPAEEQEKLFHKFNRASNANTASVYGTGLGLYIAKEIIKAHKGWIHITSEGVGKGTVFTIELPLVQDNDEEASADM